VEELWNYFRNDDPDVKVRAFPGEGLTIPLYILGSSTDSAHLAASLGLPYAFAAHFAPAQLKAALKIYRNEFRPSQQLKKPHVMVCVNAFGADTDQEAFRLSTSMFRMFIGMVTNRRAPLSPPVDSLDPYWTPDIQHAVAQMTACTFIGSKESLRQQFVDFFKEVAFDELIISSYIYDMDAKLYSYQIVRDAFHSMS
jgi:luciferase family oxidoreductase group 1